jgi:glycosyltransferase involved in cell wall biosynthesis
MHDCIIEGDVRFAAGWHLRLAQRMVTHAVLSRAAAVAIPTKASLTEVLRFYPGAPNPTVVPKGVDLRPFDAVTSRNVAAARDRYRLPEHFVLAVGAHRPHKNYDMLVRAMLGVPRRCRW